jgi:hypothetical protein
MKKLDEMWAALAAYQPKADAEGHGDTWAKMCKEKTSDAARAAWSAADAYAKATASAETAVAAKAADKSVQSAIDRINKLKE